MQFDTIIAGGRLVTENKILRADLGVHSERIAAIGPQLAQKHGASARVLDARGRYVIPGGIDAWISRSARPSRQTTSIPGRGRQPAAA